MSVESRSSLTDAENTEENINTSTPTITAVNPNRSSMHFFQRAGFGLGHIFNDLCASVWFSYTLLFLKSVLNLPATEAGTLIMLGQVSDAAATPIVGYLTDRFSTKRKWHMFGTLLIFLTFPLIFSVCPLCNKFGWWYTALYFAVIIITFQFGWAMVQITHLAMIPEMSLNQKDSNDLTATRYSASIFSNVLAYFVTWSMLQRDSRPQEQKIGPDDKYRFRDIALMLTLVGLTMTVLFHYSLIFSGYERRRIRRREKQTMSIVEATKSEGHSSSDTEKLVPHSTFSRTSWLKSPLLYQNAFLYVFARLFLTSSLIYVPLWLDEKNHHNSSTSTTVFGSYSSIALYEEENSIQHLATIPLVSFGASFLSSLTLEQVNRWVSNKISYLFGSAVSVAGCILILTSISDSNETSQMQLYSIAFLFGVGSSVTMISSLCITADMIGKNTQHGGFIYSAVTFADKLITGIIVVIIEAMNCSKRSECPKYYGYVLSILCGTSALLGLITLGSLHLTTRVRSRTSHNL